jgi:ribosomal protein S19
MNNSKLHNSYFRQKITLKSKIWARNNLILSTDIGKNFYVYNGKEFKKIFITREKVGFKFGNFCSTRKFSKKIKTNIKKKK